MFGAFIGGEFVASLFAVPLPPVVVAPGGLPAPVLATPFTVLALALAAGGAFIMLVLLAVMRKAVGPMRGHKRKPQRH